MFEDFDNYLEQSINKEFAGLAQKNCAHEQIRIDNQQWQKKHLDSQRLRMAFFEFHFEQKQTGREIYFR